VSLKGIRVAVRSAEGEGKGEQQGTAGKIGKAGEDEVGRGNGGGGDLQAEGEESWSTEEALNE